MFTGSDGGWVPVLEGLGIGVNPLVPANCGWETPWPPEVLATAEGRPLKNLVVRAGEAEAKGELMVTAYGLEGGAIYQLGPALRAMKEPLLQIDFKPDFLNGELLRKMESVRGFRPPLTRSCAAICRRASRWRSSLRARKLARCRSPPRAPSPKRFLPRAGYAGTSWMKP